MIVDQPGGALLLPSRDHSAASSLENANSCSANRALLLAM
jgi:hypothetical protein